MHLLNTYVLRVIHGSGRLLTVSLLAATVAVFVAACGNPSAKASAPRTTAVAASKHSGDVDVIAAGSLDTVLSKTVDKAFHKATGYTVVLTTGASGADATDIKNGVYVEDVFISASPADDQVLVGSKNGSWLKWYAAFANSPEVLGYYPKSPFAHDLKTMPWYKVITKKGFRLGRTDPSQDPGGVLAREALLETAQAKHLPALKEVATETSDEYPEDTEEAAIQNGQLDGSFMYEADARSQHSPFVKLAGTHLAGDYTITMVKNEPHGTAAEAFIKFLLGPTGEKEMRADKFGIVSPAKVTGSYIPLGLRALFK